MSEPTVLEDDAKEPIKLMVEHRLPWLAVGLVGGVIAIMLAARFEKLILDNIELSFFIPVIVYMADAVGHQAESVFVRNLGKRTKVKFWTYLIKEFILGVVLGGLFGLTMAIFAYFWFGQVSIAVTVGLAMSITMAIAPIIALIVPEIIFKEHADPAIGSGPFATVIQDLLSLTIYFLIASVIIL